MKNIKDMFVNGCNIIYCTDKAERDRFKQQFIADNPEYDFDIREEFFDNRKSGLFGAPTAFNILKKNKTVKRKHSVEDIIHLLKGLGIYYFADRIPRVMSNQSKIMYSVAYDILENGRTAFMLGEGGRCTREVLAYVATRVHYYTRGLKFVWVTESAHKDAEILKSCNKLFELKDGELTERRIECAPSDVKESGKSAGSLFERVAEHLKTEPAPAEKATAEIKTEPVPTVKEPVKADIKPKFISKGRMPVSGKVCRFSDGTEAIVLSSKHNPIKNSDCYKFALRDIKTGEAFELSVMWSRRVENPTYYSFCQTSTPRPGAKETNLGSFFCYYETETRNAEYGSYEAELRYCTYQGDNLFKDLFTGEIYTPIINTEVTKELAKVKKGDIVSVCLYCGRVYFGGSYRTSENVAVYAASKNNDFNYYYAANYGLLTADKVYEEKDGKFVEAAAEKNGLYIFHSVHALCNNAIYADMGIDEPFAWITPAKGESKYGLLKGNYHEKLEYRTLSFTPFNEEKTYVVNTQLFSKEFLEFLCQKAIPVKAEVFESGRDLAIPATTPLERQTLEYTYQDGDVAMCMDMDSFEMVEFPCADIPDDITEGCIFDYYPEIKYFSLQQTAASDETEEEPVGESVVTYEGFDTSKQAHVIRIVDGSGKTAEYTYGDGEIEFVDKDIKKGDRVDMRLSFNDETCSLNAHLSKYKG